MTGKDKYDKNFWRCTCDKTRNFSDRIHPATKDSCCLCGAERDSSPHATSAEVETLLFLNRISKKRLRRFRLRNGMIVEDAENTEKDVYPVEYKIVNSEITEKQFETGAKYNKGNLIALMIIHDDKKPLGNAYGPGFDLMEEL